MKRGSKESGGVPRIEEAKYLTPRFSPKKIDARLLWKNVNGALDFCQ
jgi:hypothetical protein